MQQTVEQHIIFTSVPDIPLVFVTQSRFREVIDCDYHCMSLPADGKSRRALKPDMKEMKKECTSWDLYQMCNAVHCKEKIQLTIFVLK